MKQLMMMQGVAEYVSGWWRRWTRGNAESTVESAVGWASDQPDWDGLKDALVVDAKDFMRKLTSETIAESLTKRGYAVLKLSQEVVCACQNMHAAMEAFMKQPDEEKAKFATKTDDTKYSPNQYHGYSKMKGLKEQFMVRACGDDMPLLFPGTYNLKGCPDADMCPHFGSASLQLYHLLDSLCRSVLEQVCDAQHIPRKKAMELLDPVPSDHSRPEITISESECWTSYVIPGYISTSLLDMFHYYNKFDREDGSHEKYKNNHLSHTDSGILTLVPCAAIPGLEVYDQSLSEWIAVEKIIHEVSDGPGSEVFATVFWGDSCVYLTGDDGHPCLHRVVCNLLCHLYN
jgi:isopenicillin N synthase-like dioxygenase